MDYDITIFNKLYDFNKQGGNILWELGNHLCIVFRIFFYIKGRARRSEFWYFVLFSFLSGLFLFGVWMGSIFLHLRFLTFGLLFFILIYGVIIFLSSLSASTRRLHDTDHSGWWLFSYYLFYLVYYALIMVVGFYFASQTTHSSFDVDQLLTQKPYSNYMTIE
ncbi:DUF805 domain-containing protein [Neisseriaceae bacterium PsAf]|nr:DUF805 domain-containing protein [Neisseriaceae bacterium PsAf]